MRDRRESGFIKSNFFFRWGEENVILFEFFFRGVLGAKLVFLKEVGFGGCVQYKLDRKWVIVKLKP